MRQMGNIMVRQLLLGSVQTNCYLIYDDQTMETIVIDPADHADRIRSVLEENGLKPVVILLTHGHFDHIGAVSALKQFYSIPVYCHEQEEDLMENSKQNVSLLFGNPLSLKADGTVTDREVLHYLGRDITVLHTPGHTKGSCCYYFEADHFLMSGDTLFAESVGRTDLPTGNMGTLVRSIRDILFRLPDETVVYPGHNEETTIGHEKMYNLFVRE